MPICCFRYSFEQIYSANVASYFRFKHFLNFDTLGYITFLFNFDRKCYVYVVCIKMK